MDQGCPLSPLLSSLGLAGALHEITKRLQVLDASAKLSAYLDDVVLTARPRLGPEIHAHLCLQPLLLSGFPRCLCWDLRSRGWTGRRASCMPPFMLSLMSLRLSARCSSLPSASLFCGWLACLLKLPSSSCKNLGSRVSITYNGPTTRTASGWGTSRVLCIRVWRAWLNMLRLLSYDSLLPCASRTVAWLSGGFGAAVRRLSSRAGLSASRRSRVWWVCRRCRVSGAGAQILLGFGTLRRQPCARRGCPPRPWGALRPLEFMARTTRRGNMQRPLCRQGLRKFVD